MSKFFIGTIAASTIALVALIGYYVWHQTTPEKCYTGMGAGQDLSCVDGERRR